MSVPWTCFHGFVANLLALSCDLASLSYILCSISKLLFSSKLKLNVVNLLYLNCDLATQFYFIYYLYIVVFELAKLTMSIDALNEGALHLPIFSFVQLYISSVQLCINHKLSGQIEGSLTTQRQRTVVHITKPMLKLSTI